MHFVASSRTLLLQSTLVVVFLAAGPASALASGKEFELQVVGASVPETGPILCNELPPLLSCPGDCNADFEVRVDEIVRGVTIALGLSPVARCLAVDANNDSQVTIDELVSAVRYIFEGCPLDAGAIYEVDVCQGQRFRILMRDPLLIELAEDILSGTEPQKIVTGELRCGPGGFNGPWSWHLDPASLAFTDAAIELCDGCPSFIEEELDYWLRTVRRYCPWSTRLVRRIR